MAFNAGATRKASTGRGCTITLQSGPLKQLLGKRQGILIVGFQL
jgi:hypothetical protein